MSRREAFLLTGLMFMCVSAADAEITLTVNGLDATKPLEIEAKEGLTIAVAGQSDARPRDISITSDNGKLEPSKTPSEYLLAFANESDVAIVGLNVNGEVVYQLILLYNPDTGVVIVFGVDKEALEPAPQQSEPELSTQPKQPILEPETHDFVTLSFGDCNDILDPNLYPNLNNDQVVNFEDFAILAGNWLASGDVLDGDFDKDETVDINDLAYLSYFWLANACGPSPEGVFELFKVALLADDVNEAVSYLAEVSAENYRLFLEQLRPYFTQMVNEMGELIFIRSGTEMAVYDLLREEDGNTYAYPVLFVRDEMGQWKICDF